MAPSRAEIVADYAERLQSWAVSQVAKLWSQMDADDVRGSWARIQPALMAVHERVCVDMLDTVDRWMFAEAADAGFRYDVTWQQDRPQRPFEVYWGGDARTYIGRAPIIVLWRIKQGDDVTTAMRAGLNHLLSIFSTEAHQILRNVTVDRVVAG